MAGDLDARILACLEDGPRSLGNLTGLLLDVQRPVLEGRLVHLRNTGQVRLLAGEWSATGERHDPPPTPDHRRIPEHCEIAHQPPGEMSGPTSLLTPTAPRETKPSMTPAGESAGGEDPPMAKLKACRTCGETKLLNQYDRANRSPDLHTADCTACRTQAGKPPPPARKAADGKAGPAGPLAAVVERHVKRPSAEGSVIDRMEADLVEARARVTRLEAAIAAVREAYA